MRREELPELLQRDIVLIGFRCAGKTTLGKRLASQLGWKWFDTDDYLDRALFRIDETRFREKEREVVRNLPSGPAVISTGGGTVLDPDNVKVLRRRGHLVYLDVPKEELIRRMQSNPPPYDFEAVYKERLKLYQTIADYHVEQ